MVFSQLVCVYNLKEFAHSINNIDCIWTYFDNNKLYIYMLDLFTKEKKINAW